MSQEISVSMERKGSVIDLDFASQALGQVHVDTAELPEDERAGHAKKLLGSSVLFCYVAALDKALATRACSYDTIRAQATVKAGSDDKGRGRIVGIRLDVDVLMDAEYEELFERVKKVMRNGCLISASLEPAIPIEYNLNLVCPDD
ncbi:MAG: OsmC family protein [Desulfovibrionaceae bacterium]|nr:OsmC family protein [Desulfovibrionaceae bacterium]